jgi:SAM-dependent methyltransferase
MKEIGFISSPAGVDMADSWYEIATPNHFWIRRRFDVLMRLTRGLYNPSHRVAEIGCGNGLLQCQFEKSLGINVDGFDLNCYALQENVSNTSSIFCYDVQDRCADLCELYDIILLFDVLEHIESESAFLDAVLFHLKPGGYLIVNTPALMSLYSKYDQIAGHKRRYSYDTLSSLLRSHNLSIPTWSYWGLPFLPLLHLRRRLVSSERDDRVIQKGYDARGPIMNKLLYLLAHLETVPNVTTGTSIMMVSSKCRGTSNCNF